MHANPRLRRTSRTKKGGEARKPIRRSKRVTKVRTKRDAGTSRSNGPNEDHLMRHLSDAVKRIQSQQKNSFVQDGTMKGIMAPVESFLRRKRLVCYGGTAINAILPPKDQFYDFSKELPDYDFFSPNAIEDAKKLAREYYNKGYQEVEAKSGVHLGTYKVFVNFTPVADITQMDVKVYRRLHREAIEKDGILYCPPHYLQMSMYLELSRPMGDVSRWEKVFTRLQLLNRTYPIQGVDCCRQTVPRRHTPVCWRLQLREELIRRKGVFFGSLALSHLEREMGGGGPSVCGYDVLCKNHKEEAKGICQTLKNHGLRCRSFPGKAEVLPPRTEIRKNDALVATLYEPIACHAYTEISVDGKSVRIATIETMMSLYLAFLYTKCNRSCIDRILCVCEFLFRIRKRNPIVSRGPLQTFVGTCFGKQATLQSMRAEKTRTFRELRKKPRSKEFERWFLKYVPLEHVST